ncbi:MAG: hypothetical protein J0H49_31130 [Acidobacteria bacterium]|nr:hypothetical protein [Acidobacteriota bacterium]
MVQLGQIAIDGSKVAANASQRKSHSYAKLSEREQNRLETVEQILKDAQAKDEQDALQLDPSHHESAEPGPQLRGITQELSQNRSLF